MKTIELNKGAGFEEMSIELINETAEGCNVRVSGIDGRDFREFDHEQSCDTSWSNVVACAQCEKRTCIGCPQPKKVYISLKSGMISEGEKKLVVFKPNTRRAVK